MAESAFVVTIRFDTDRSFHWKCDSIELAKEKVADVHQHGFIYGDEGNPAGNVEFIPPEHIQEVKLGVVPALVCIKCHSQTRASGADLCSSCEEYASSGKASGDSASEESPLCERCKTMGRLSGERYCSACKKEVLREMREAGYLASAPSPSIRKRRVRTEPSEDRQGDWDNTIRASEDGSVEE